MISEAGLSVIEKRLRPPAMLVPDMAWCWWTRPRATRLGNEAWFAAVDTDGGMAVAKIDLATRAVTRTGLAQFEDDDHNNPALLVTPDKPMVCFYSRHDADEGMRYRISKAPLSLNEWGPEQILSFGGSTTYAQVHPLGDELHLFTRVDGPRWAWRLSPDWGRTWEPHRDFLAFDTDWLVYMPTALLADGRTLRVAVSGHPREASAKPLHDVWACLVDLMTGAVTLPSGGGAIANLRTGEGLPLNYDRLELVSKTPADRTANLFDVSSGPEFEIGFVTKIKDDFSTRDGRHHVATLRDGGWQVDDLVATGQKFGYVDAGLYVGSITFPDRGPAGQCYLTREEDGLWHLERWRRDASGHWSGEPLVEPSPTRLTRPWAITNPTPDLAVVALALERYDDDSYYGSLSHLVGAA
jgi:hypothetical protein